MIREMDIMCSGKSVNLNVRPKSDLSKRILRKLYKPIVDNGQQHEIANNYKDFRQMRHNRYRRKSKRQSYAPRNFSPIPRKILQIPSLIFPRLGKNFSWRGRQTICQLPKSNLIESEKLLQIRAASSLQDFRRLLCNHQTNGSYRPCTRHDQCLIQFQSKPSTANASCNPVSCTKQVFQRHEVSSDLYNANTFYDDIDTVPPAPASSPQYNRQGQHQPQQKQHRFLQATAGARCGGNEGGNDDVDHNAEYLEWYIELASRCYTEGFLWHMNYLNGCSERQSALLQQRLQLTQQQNSRRHSSNISDSYKLDNPKSRHRFSVSEHNNPTYQNIYVQNYDSDATEDNDNCKISININNSGRVCKPQQSTHTYNCSPASYASNSTSKSTTTLEQQSNVRSYHIMNDNDNDSSRGIDAINNNKQLHHHQKSQHVAKLNEVIDNFCSLNISCDAGAYLLPQIILTDFSSAATINEQPKSTTLLLSQQQQQHQAPGAFGLPITHEPVNRANSRVIAAPESSSPLLNELLCLSIPSHADKYVRSESRPP